MRIKLAVACAGVLALALPLTAGAGSHGKVTGGGQVLFSNDGGAGNTIAFTAHDAERRNSGQVQYVDRQSGNKFHGTVTCVEIHNDNSATFGGSWDRASSEDRFFEIHVWDNGPGPNDGIIIDHREQAPNCDGPDENDRPDELGRGNLTVHSGNGGNGDE